MGRYVVRVEDVKSLKLFRRVMVIGMISYTLILAPLVMLIESVAKVLSSLVQVIIYLATALSIGVGVFLALYMISLVVRGGSESDRGEKPGLINLFKEYYQLYREKKEIINIYEKYGLRRVRR